GIRDLTVTGVQTCALPIFEETLLDRLGHRAAAAATHLHAVNRTDWRHLDGGANEKSFVRDVERFARERLLGDAEAEVAGNRHHEIGRASCRERAEYHGDAV